MADTRISQLTASGAIADGDLLPIVDISDTTDSAQGTTRKITKANLTTGLAPTTSPVFATSVTGSYLTASEILITDASKNLVSAPVATYPSLTELTYVKGVTSALQTQINAKGSGTVTSASVTTANGVSGTVATATTTPAITLTLGAITPSSTNGVSSTTMAYLDATSSVQTQLNGKQASGSYEVTTAKDATGGYAGLTLFKINFKNAANTFTNFFTNATTAARTYTFPDKDITVAGIVDITGTNSGTNTGDQTTIAGITGTMAQFDTAVSDGNIVYQSGALGTPASGTLTNATGLPVAGITASTVTALGVGSVEVGHATDSTLSRSAAGVLAVEGVVIPSISSTNTLTNKRVNPRFTTAASYTTSTTIDSDVNDQYIVTAQAGALLFNNPTGTPVDGQTLIIAVTGTAARALTYGTAFEASTVALPATTVTTARLNIGFIWRADTSKWICLASA